MQNCLISKYLLMIILRTIEMFFLEGLKNHVLYDVARLLDVDISKDEVEKVMSHLHDKSPSQDRLTNEVFKKYLNLVEGAFYRLILEGVGDRRYPSFLEYWSIKFLPKVPSIVSFTQWRPFSLMGGMYKISRKSDGQ